jgi:5'-nucleotidase
MASILVTNDDGVQSDGVHKLAEALRGFGQVTIVAPITEASAIGHALTLKRPLRIEPVREGVYAVDGTPTDCVNLAITSILRELPSLVVSGINKGLNVGDDVTYSGTVAGALEAALLGVPALAVSLEGGLDYDFGPAARMGASAAEALLRSPLPARTFLNVNVPRGKINGVRTTVQARRNHITAVTARLDPRGREYFWIDEAQDDWEPHDRSDYQAVKDGYVSVTPLQPDLTAHAHLSLVESMSLEFDRPSFSSR